MKLGRILLLAGLAYAANQFLKTEKGKKLKNQLNEKAGHLKNKLNKEINTVRNTEPEPFEI